MTERLPIFESVLADFRAGRLQSGRHEWRDHPPLRDPGDDQPTVRLPPQQKDSDEHQPVIDDPTLAPQPRLSPDR